MGISETVLDYLKKNPGQTSRQISNGLKLMPRTVIYGLRNLEEKELVKSNRTMLSSAEISDKDKILYWPI